MRVRNRKKKKEVYLFIPTGISIILAGQKFFPKWNRDVSCYGLHIVTRLINVFLPPVKPLGYLLFYLFWFQY